ncbi:MAG: hypothetical protein IIC46_08555 [Planctomycetes bacterium]|nr:hypothetical protein [Planctomycetota bacterium]
MSRESTCCAILVLTTLAGTAVAGVDVEFLFPDTPYLSAADSPFDLFGKGSDFLLEDFEDGLLNSLGLLGFGGVIRFPSSFTDSVDADDGLIDGFGTDGHDYWTSAGLKGGPAARFEFDPKALGALPRSVGIVWTDGNVDAITIFEAFGPDGRSLGTMEFFALDDGRGQGGTAEDRFMGVIFSGGISAIEIRADLGRIELDHVQYGNLVPAPGALGLLSLAGLFGRRSRRS